MSEIRKEIGLRIREVRILRFFTQQELGDKVYLTRSSIANVETGRQNMTIDTLYAIADALQVTVMDLLAPNFYETLPFDGPVPETESVTIKVFVNDEERASFKVPKYGRVKGDG